MVKRLTGEREGQGNSEETFRRKRKARKIWMDFQEKEKGKLNGEGTSRRKRRARKWWRDLQEKEKGKEIVKRLSGEREGQGNGEETSRRKRRARDDIHTSCGEKRRKRHSFEPFSKKRRKVKIWNKLFQENEKKGKMNLINF